MVNKAIIIGRVGGDPGIRTVGESKVANFSVATSEKYKDKNGEKQEKTQWHRVTAWRQLAEIIEKYVKKGILVYIEGKIEYREYESEGVKKYATDIVASEMKMLSFPDDAGKKEEAPAQEAPGGNDEPDDLPF